MISIIQLGLVDYAEGLRIQRRLIEARKAGEIGDVLLLLEHTPVITLGRNAKAVNVLLPPEQLALRGVEVYECDRGGDVTFHGPGQLVGYPIFDLRGFERSSQFSVLGSRKGTTSDTLSLPSGRKTLGAIDYVRGLEKVLIRTCADFGIATKRVAGLTGAWTDTEPESKIAAIGVHISRGVTSHGFALNVNTDLSYFDLIVPCGIASKPVTSMKKELGREVDLAEVAESVSRRFSEVFVRPVIPVETVDALVGNAIGVPMRAPADLRRLHQDDDLPQA